MVIMMISDNGKAKQNMVRNSEVFLLMIVVIMVMMVIMLMISGDRKGKWPGKG